MHPENGKRDEFEICTLFGSAVPVNVCELKRAVAVPPAQGKLSVAGLPARTFSLKLQVAVDGVKLVLRSADTEPPDRVRVEHALKHEPLEFLITYVVRTGDPVIETP